MNQQSTENFSKESRLLALACLIGFACLGVFLTFFFIDGHHQDAGTHYLCSRWAWTHHDLFVNVWARPLPTFLYALPAKYGYHTTQYLTILICAATAWQTYELAGDLKLERRWIVIPLLFLQPSFFLLYTEVMTEPLFALVLVIALRLHIRGWVKLGMFVASLMFTVRPEGFFMGVMWGVWILFDKRVAGNFFARCGASLILASGALMWAIAAYFITGDFLYIKHNWPAGWHSTYQPSLIQGLLYLWRMPYIVGVFLIPFFFTGLWRALMRRDMLPVTTSFLTLFVLHSVLRALGAFGTAGYPRYFVCVAPSLAIITLVGWNYIFNQLIQKNFSVKLNKGIAAGLIVFSLFFCLIYKEGEPWAGDEGASWSRDARAINEVYEWFQANPRPVNHIAWSQSYMGVIFGRDLYEQPQFTADKDSNVKLLRELPSGTLVVWDARTGSNWYTLTAADIESAGYKKIYDKGFSLDGNFIKFPVLWYVNPRQQEFYLLYKE